MGPLCSVVFLPSFKRLDTEHSAWLASDRITWLGPCPDGEQLAEKRKEEDEKGRACHNTCSAALCHSLFFLFFRYLFYLIWLFLWCESFYKRRKTGRYLLYIRFNKKPNKKERELATTKNRNMKENKRRREKKNKFNLAHFIVSHLHGATLAASVNAPSGWTWWWTLQPDGL